MSPRQPEQAASASSPDEIHFHVLVTGFGPFDNTPINSSFPIAHSLPSTIAPCPPPPPSSPRIHIHIHPHPTPLRVSYRTVRETVPALLFPPQPCLPPAAPSVVPASPAMNGSSTSAPVPALPSNPDSLPSPSSSPPPPPPPQPQPSPPPPKTSPSSSSSAWATDQHTSSKQPPTATDTSNPTSTDRKCATINTGPSLPPIPQPPHHKTPLHRDQQQHPQSLTSPLPTPTLLHQWQRTLAHRPDVVDVDLQLSSDAGRYLCEFTYYTGLVEYWRRGRAAAVDVLFLHVPRGREVVVGLVGAVVEGWMGEEGRGNGREKGGRKGTEGVR